MFDASVPPATPPDATPTAPVQPSAPNAWDKFVTAVAKPWAVIGARQQTAAEKGRKNGTLAGFVINPLGATRHPVPDMARPGSLGSTDYSNRPVIQILSDTDATAQTTAPVFSDWILNSVTGGDAEKAEVVETFGIPHVFTSGRFMRRYTFSGSLRTTLTGGRTSGGSRGGTSRPTVSHYAAFLRFYDDYLRITKQAETGRFTRITVDGEVFDGWVLSMTPTRDSGSEGFASFTFTFVARDRNHPGQATELTRYLKRFAGTPRTTRPKARAVLNAEIVAATGTNKITVSATGTQPKVTAVGFYPVATVTLAAPGPLQLTGSMPGATFTFTDGRDSTVAQKDQAVQVGITVSELAKFVGGSATIKVQAGTTKESIAFTAENAQPKASPGVISGAVRGSSPPISFPDLTRLQTVPLNAAPNGVVSLGLEFKREVNTSSVPTMTGSEGATATVTATSSRSATLTLTLPAAALTDLQNNVVPEKAFTFNSSSGTFDLPSFTLRVLSASGATTPNQAIPTLRVAAAGTRTTTWEVTVSGAFAPGAGRPDDVLAAYNLKIVDSYGTYDSNSGSVANPGVFVPLTGDKTATLQIGTTSARVRPLRPTADENGFSMRVLLFFYAETPSSGGSLTFSLIPTSPYLAPNAPVTVLF